MPLKIALAAIVASLLVFAAAWALMYACFLANQHGISTPSFAIPILWRISGCAIIAAVISGPASILIAAISAIRKHTRKSQPYVKL